MRTELATGSIIIIRETNGPKINFQFFNGSILPEIFTKPNCLRQQQHQQQQR
jgi:hypothetical protein